MHTEVRTTSVSNNNVCDVKDTRVTDKKPIERSFVLCDIVTNATTFLRFLFPIISQEIYLFSYVCYVGDNNISLKYHRSNKLLEVN